MLALSTLRFPVVLFGLRPNVWIGLGVLLLAGSVSAASTLWQNATPEELAQRESSLEPGAAVEAISRRIEIDDSQYPSSRTIREYVRYKIFDPERADTILRLSKRSLSFDGDDIQTANMKARLTQPDGSIREFGAESLHERL